jgi:hypothetical protein
MIKESKKFSGLSPSKIWLRIIHFFDETFTSPNTVKLGAVMDKKFKKKG